MTTRLSALLARKLIRSSPRNFLLSKTNMLKGRYTRRMVTAVKNRINPPLLPVIPTTDSRKGWPSTSPISKNNRSILPELYMGGPESCRSSAW